MFLIFILPAGSSAFSYRNIIFTICFFSMAVCHECEPLSCAGCERCRPFRPHWKAAGSTLSRWISRIPGVWDLVCGAKQREDLNSFCYRLFVFMSHRPAYASPGVLLITSRYTHPDTLLLLFIYLVEKHWVATFW